MSQSRGVPYYFRAPANGDAGESRWDPPLGMSENEINALPGASKYLQESQRSEDDSMRASHLLVKHRDSRRPSSWREVELIPYHIWEDWPNHCAVRSLISLVPRKKPLKSSRVIKPRSMALPRNSQSMPGNILTAPPQTKAEIWAPSRKVRCSDHSKKRRYTSRLEK